MEQSSPQGKRKRAFCNTCDRPQSVCICSSLPRSKVDTKTTIYILTHPKEKSFKMRTGRISELTLQKAIVYVGRRYSNREAFRNFEQLIKTKPKSCLLLFPCKEAKPIGEFSMGNPTSYEHIKVVEKKSNTLTAATVDQLLQGNTIGDTSTEKQTLTDTKVNSDETKEVQVRIQPMIHQKGSNVMEKKEIEGSKQGYNLIVIDATWKFASEMVRDNADLFQHVTKVQFTKNMEGQFVIRKPPQKGYISTHEAIVHALHILEPKTVTENVVDVLMKPVHLMVEHQLQFKKKKAVHRNNKPGYIPKLYESNATVPSTAKILGNSDKGQK